jgi:HD-GYP domain-containing protein (c-di-GMP phosphodiesterase class II)
VNASSALVEMVLAQHERWDGMGYPRRLTGERIPLGGRILAIVGMFDLLTTDRPYRRAMSHREALTILKDGAGKQFDPQLVERFEVLLPELSEEIERLEVEALVLA